MPLPITMSWVRSLREVKHSAIVQCVLSKEGGPKIRARTLAGAPQPTAQMGFAVNICDVETTGAHCSGPQITLIASANSLKSRLAYEGSGDGHGKYPIYLIIFEDYPLYSTWPDSQRDGVRNLGEISPECCLRAAYGPGSA